jgi:hypothetical protein
MRLPEAIRKWRILAKDFDDIVHDLTEEILFVGTEKEVNNRADELSCAYEAKYDIFLSSIIIEACGIMWQGPGKLGGLKPISKRHPLTPEQRNELKEMRICNQPLTLERATP